MSRSSVRDDEDCKFVAGKRTGYCLDYHIRKNRNRCPMTCDYALNNGYPVTEIDMEDENYREQLSDLEKKE